MSALGKQPTTPIAPKSSSVKRKKTNVIFLILEMSYKNSKVFIDAMEHINATHA
jgi:hypothetical protein